MLFVLGKVVKAGLIIGLALMVFDLFSGSDDTESWRILFYGDPMTEHVICPECDAELSEQAGFDEFKVSWTCTDCGTELHHPYLYDWEDEEIVACCPFCDAELPEQKGFDESLPYWICTECDAILVNPDSGFEYAWFCEDCDAYLNEQDGFTEDCGRWECKECGCVNEIDLSEVGSNGNTVCNN